MTEETKLPPEFKYRAVYLQGRPVHGRLDAFAVKHPQMDVGKRAKIFAPFAALRGFEEEIDGKKQRYEPRRELSPEAAAELSRRLGILYALGCTAQGTKSVTVCVTYFVPCEDPHHEAFGRLGQYRTCTGRCCGVDPDLTRSICVEREHIAFEDILCLDSPAGIFAAARTEDGEAGGSVR